MQVAATGSDALRVTQNTATTNTQLHYISTITALGTACVLHRDYSNTAEITRITSYTGGTANDQGQLEFATNDGTAIRSRATIDEAGVMAFNATYGTGLKFPADLSAADANTLDDYEEGSWTPVLWDNTNSDAEGQTYSIQYGRYVKVGELVSFWGRISISSTGTLTGSEGARIGGLPFLSNSTTYDTPPVLVGYWGSVGTAFVKLSGLVNGNTVYFDVRHTTAATQNVSTTIITALSTGDIIFRGQYRIN
ncbi:MAG: hypothetical protein ACYTEQ_30635 [Planctomycetota bacterium]